MIKIPSPKFSTARNNSHRVAVIGNILENHEIFSSTFLSFLMKKIIKREKQNNSLLFNNKLHANQLVMIEIPLGSKEHKKYLS